MRNSKLAIEGGEPIRQKPFPTIADSSGRDIGDEELELLTQVIRSGSLNRNGGTMVVKFEEEFASFYSRKYAIASTSGTAAIHIALGSLDLNPGDEVITGPITDIGTINPILFQNAIPIFADLDLRTYNMDPDSIEERITDRTKAILVVHLFGNPSDMNPIMKIAKEYNLYVIEDSCQAYLAEYKGKMVGTIGDIGCFSLQQSKHMTAGDGGITILDDDKLGQRAILFSDKAWPRAEGRVHPFLAPNYRMTELQGAVALAQLRKVKGVVERRRKAAASLTKRIKDIPGIITPYVAEDTKHSYWLYPLRIEEDVLGVSRDEFAKALNEEGIPGGSYIANPVYMYEFLVKKRTYGDSGCPFNCPLYGREINYEEGMCPNSEAILKDILVLPMNEFFTEEDITDIAGGIGKVAEYYLAKRNLGGSK